jgi:steroid 5-alpha reductase family enzyme
MPFPITACCVLLLLLLMLCAVWLLSLRLGDVSIVDIFWGLGFAVAALVALFMAEAAGTRAILLTGMTCVWGFRLAAHLAWRKRGKPEDHRYRAMREHHGERFGWISLWTVFVLQALLIWFVSFPVQAGVRSRGPLAALDAVGLGMWLVGFLFESIGDWQLARFLADPASSGRVMDAGLWRYTRHPNYFGDFLVWWGIYLVAAAGGAWWSIFSPLLMSFLLLRVSGVALLDRTLQERRSGYREYIERTSAFFPWPPRRP